MALVISPGMEQKLSKKVPPVSRDEIVQCFANRTGIYLYDTREKHRSDPPTQWFISLTDFGRKLKVVFMHKDGNIYLRTAYTPKPTEIAIYSKYGEL
ncbi:MAG: ADP-ribosyl-(dinitrogen reductase) hydrolase [Gammaproteobacteria bacterium]